MKSDHIALAVTDLDRSRWFYSSLGGKIVGKESPNFLEVILGDLHLHMIEAKEKKVNSDSGPKIHHFCMQVENLEELNQVKHKIENLCPDQSLTIQESPPMGRDFIESAEQRPPVAAMYCRDPDGILIEFRYYA